MKRILGISGSLRRASFNSALLAVVQETLAGTADVEIVSIRGIPLYDADVEAAEGLPPIVSEIKEKLAAADGLLIATPEYNSSIPGVVKNAIDWLSRPSSDVPRVFGGLPVALLGATPSRGGTMLSQTAWLPILRYLGTRPWFGGSLYVSGAPALFDDTGLTDEETRRRLDKFSRGFFEYVEIVSRQRHDH